MPAGVFISFEGIDGCGKTTQARLLAERLVAASQREVVLTREPGGTPLGQTLRRLLLNGLGTGAPGTEPVLAWETEALLMAADRAEHVARVIKPALARGAVVVCDRYVDSSFAYQGYGAGRSLEQVRAINEVATQGVLPALTLLLALPPARQYRPHMGEDRIETRGLAYQQRVYEGFLLLAQTNPRISVLDVAGKSPGEVAAMVWNACLTRCPSLL